MDRFIISSKQSKLNLKLFNTTMQKCMMKIEKFYWDESPENLNVAPISVTYSDNYTGPIFITCEESSGMIEMKDGNTEYQTQVIDVISKNLYDELQPNLLNFGSIGNYSRVDETLEGISIRPTTNLNVSFQKDDGNYFNFNRAKWQPTTNTRDYLLILKVYTI